MQYETMDRANNHYLSKAVETLNNFGTKIFDKFCHDHDVSFCDINRCIAKCKFLYKRDDLNEYQLPDRLKQARWHHYTVICRYEPNKAREMLRAIDESYENQFIPKFESEKFTAGVKSVDE